jgi:hypothetical protein
MKLRQLTILLVLMMILPVFLNLSLPSKAETTQTPPSLYVGVDVAYESITATEQLIDKISSYSNFFVIGCLGNGNETRLTIISQYVYDKNMSFIVYADDPGYPSQQWIETAKTKWGNSFLGLYVYDEPGGRQLDFLKFPTVTSAANYTDAAYKFNNSINWYLHLFDRNFSPSTEYKLFTSDYALYWYDYKAGYDSVFAEFGWNYSRQLNVALARGAAAVQNKDWGVMITWTYTDPPYIESGPELYDDMVLAYNNGAKYIIVFDTNEDYTQEILGQEHLDAMQQFWQYTQDNPRGSSPTSDRIAYVLPDNYAYGFRGPLDKVWGLWEADWFSVNISMSVSSLLGVCGTNLDIVYPYTQPISSFGYRQVIYWNDTRLLPEQLSEIPTSPTPRSTPKPFSSPTAIPSTTPWASPSPDPPAGFQLPVDYIYVITASIVGVAVLVGVFVFRKRRQPTGQGLTINKRNQYSSTLKQLL